MKSRQNPSPLDGFEAFKKVSQENRQIAYENKVCKKILKLKFQEDDDGYTEWYSRIRNHSEPLLEMQPLFSHYALRSFRLESWGFEDLLLRPTKCPVWKVFASEGAELQEAFPDLYPAMVFYNSAIQQDMVIHSNYDSMEPKGHFRMIRLARSEEGGVVVDTLAGFVETL
tara:strand:+ start:1800 stop:2309 length:510 start_codon:yes stop_codon:yes gene_type:complete